MELVGGVDPNQIPQRAERRSRFGVWTGLVAQAIGLHEQGQATLVKLEDDDEYHRMRNGCAEAFRKSGYRCEYSIVRHLPARNIDVYLELRVSKQEEPHDEKPPRRPAANGIRPRIRRLPTGTQV